jgi:hypothetical protein
MITSSHYAANERPEAMETWFCNAPQQADVRDEMGSKFPSSSGFTAFLFPGNLIMPCSQHRE